MSELVPSNGSARLAAVLQRHEGAVLGAMHAPLEWGSIVSLGTTPSGATILGLQPDSWTAAAFRPGQYHVLEPLHLGLVRTELERLQLDGGHGGHPGDAGAHDHDEHRHALEFPILPLAPGDRVVVAWLSGAPVVMGRALPS
jgi:hypothetical protein